MICFFQFFDRLIISCFSSSCSVRAGGMMSTLSSAKIAVYPREVNWDTLNRYELLGSISMHWTVIPSISTVPSLISVAPVPLAMLTLACTVEFCCFLCLFVQKDVTVFDAPESMMYVSLVSGPSTVSLIVFWELGSLYKTIPGCSYQGGIVVGDVVCCWTFGWPAYSGLV